MGTIQDCQKIQPLLSEYVDGALGEQDAWSIQLHLASCAVCARIANDFTATSRLLASLPQPELSADFEAKLVQRLADTSLRPQPLSPWERLRHALVEAWSTPWLRPAFAAGAALAVLTPVALMVSSPTGGSKLARATPSPRINVTPTGEAAGSSGSIEQLWSEHVSYASSEPLSNPAGLLPTDPAEL